MSTSVEIVRLNSVILSREKQDALQKEIERYAKAVNFVIRTILTKHLASAAKTIEAIRDEFAKQFDPRPQYLEDVVKTARVRIGEHRKMARVIRTAREKRPKFKEGRIILSPPLIRVGEKALTIALSKQEVLPIPYDKRSRNREIDTLTAIAKGELEHGRVRVTWRREGFVEIEIRILISG
ncbi:MAG: hypothetical protein K9W43_07455 [Candidatus Thorarchaeota archaeon]|nr:hypothetical protein [Candidatus Thorarchaeota archaeon]